MADQFLADIAGMLEFALIGNGLVVLHHARKESAKLTKAGAYIMFVGGILGLLCTSYWWFKYNAAGVFDNPMTMTEHVIHHDSEHYYPPEHMSP